MATLLQLPNLDVWTSNYKRALGRSGGPGRELPGENLRDCSFNWRLRTSLLFYWIFSLGNAYGSANALPAAMRPASDPVAAQALVEMGGQVRDYVKGLPLRAGTTPLRFAPRL